MSKKDTGEPAFPCEGVITNDGILFEGMTLRDYFAARAMQVFITNDRTSLEQDAEDAYMAADKMLKARTK